MSIKTMVKTLPGKRRSEGTDSAVERVASPIPCGFSIIELIVVLAVIAILAAVITPPIVQKIESEVRGEEKENLTSLAGGLTTAIREDLRIPSADTADWPAAIASKLSRNEQEVRVNGRNNERRYLVDPDFGVTLPYAQDAGGLTDKPTSPRIVILSSTHSPLPSGSLDFDNIWNTAEDELPDDSTYTWSDWGSEGADLHIQRIDLRDFFLTLQIQKLDETDEATYKVQIYDPGGPVFSAEEIAPSSWERHFIRTTATELYDHNQSPALVTRERLGEGRAYYYENGVWTGHFTSGSSWVHSIADDLRNWINENNYSNDELSVSIQDTTFEVTGP